MLAWVPGIVVMISLTWHMTNHKHSFSLATSPVEPRQAQQQGNAIGWRLVCVTCTVHHASAAWSKLIRSSHSKSIFSWFSPSCTRASPHYCTSHLGGSTLSHHCSGTLGLSSGLSAGMLNSPINTNERTTLLFAFGDTIAEGSQVLKDSPPGPSPVIGAENVMMMYFTSAS